MPFLSRRSTPWLLYVLTMISALPLAAIVAAATPQPPGSCTGIGFGCSLYGWDAAGFALLLFGIPYAVILGAILGVVSLQSERWSPLATATGMVGLAIPWAFVGLIVVSGR